MMLLKNVNVSQWFPVSLTSALSVVLPFCPSWVEAHHTASPSVQFSYLYWLTLGLVCKTKLPHAANRNKQEIFWEVCHILSNEDRVTVPAIEIDKVRGELKVIHLKPLERITGMISKKRCKIKKMRDHQINRLKTNSYLNGTWWFRAFCAFFFSKCF